MALREHGKQYAGRPSVLAAWREYDRSQGHPFPHQTYIRKELLRYAKDLRARKEGDGRPVRYRRGSLQEGGDMYEAFLGCMDSREHWLLPYIRQMDTNEGMPGLVRALEGSRGRLEEGDGA